MSDKRESLQNIINFASKIERDLAVARRYANPTCTTITATPYIVGRDDIFLKEMVEREDGRVEVIITDNPWEAMQFGKDEAIEVASSIRNGNGLFGVTNVRSEAVRYVARFEPVLEHVRGWLELADK